MNNPRNHTTAILLLSLTAMFMLGLLVGRTGESPAMATTSMSTGNGFVMTSGQINRSNDALYVIDQTTNRMNVYSAYRRGQSYNLVLVATRDLNELAAAAQQGATAEE